MTEKRVQEILDRTNKLAGDRKTFESHWQECAEFCLPERANVTSERPEGSKGSRRLYDSTAMLSLEVFASALHGMLTNPAGVWFALETEDPDFMESDEVKEWLQDCASRMHRVFNNTNFHTEINGVYKTLGCFGTSPIYSAEHPQRAIYFSNRDVSECLIGEDAYGLVDTLHRRFEYTARQAVQIWGVDGVGKLIKEEFERGKDPTRKFKFIHAVYPREERDVTSLKNTDFPFASCYVCVDDEYLLQEGGYWELPYHVPRWDKTGREVYGRSPAMKVLADIKMVNEMAMTNLTAAHKMAEPPMQVPADYKDKVRLGSGGVNYYDSTKGNISQIVTVRDLAYPLEMEKERKLVIEQGFYKHLLQLPIQPNMTATEVMKRVEEQIAVMGPMIGRVFTELLNPLIDRSFGVLLRGGYLMEPPEMLMGQKIRIQYLSPLARAQKISEARAALQANDMMAPYMEIYPEMADNLDPDEMYRDVAAAVGMPEKWIRDKDAVAGMREQRSQAQAEEKMKMDLAQGADVMANLQRSGVPVVPGAEQALKQGR